jgi:hypothetical protein
MCNEIQLKARARYADQLLKYADAVVGASFLQTLGFCYKLGEQGFADMIVTVPTLIIFGCVAAGAVYSVFINKLFAGYVVLSAAEDPLTSQAKLRIQRGRYWIIAVATLVSVASFTFTLHTHHLTSQLH